MRKTVHSNHHLVVRLDDSRALGFYRTAMQPGSDGYNKEMKERCETARRDIVRHVDGLARGSDNRVAPGAVEIRYTSADVCSFCDRAWEILTGAMIGESTNPDGTCEWFEDPVDGIGLPLCCERAQEEWRDERRNVLQTVDEVFK